MDKLRRNTLKTQIKMLVNQARADLFDVLIHENRYYAPRLYKTSVLEKFLSDVEKLVKA